MANDGGLDLVTNGKLFINGGKYNHWLKIQLKGNGTTADTSAIGTRVRIKAATGLSHVRSKGRRQPGQSKRIRRSHFGFAEHADNVEYTITWTNGETQEGETDDEPMIHVEQQRPTKAGTRTRSR